MKKRALILCFAFVLLLFGGCKSDSVPSVDVWDGTVATGFSKGDGSKNKPFVIQSGEELAFLAEQVNSGNSFEGQFLSLACDIDLNNIDWSPIGNGTISFSGTFDGKEHTILNLSISDGCGYNIKVGDNDYCMYTTGLFGSSLNATIKNMQINTATITMQNLTYSYERVHAGLLVGTAFTDAESKFENIKISNATVIANSKLNGPNVFSHMNIGGAFGKLQNTENSVFTSSKIQCDLKVDIEKVNANMIFAGGLAAYIQNEEATIVDFWDCASYLTIDIKENPYLICGAVGLSSTKGSISLNNIFSKAILNADYMDLWTSPIIKAYAIIGDLAGENHSFRNAFGYVEKTNTETLENRIVTELYKINSTTASETNCQGCEVLPDSHGFNENIWDLSDLSNPRLK